MDQGPEPQAEPPRGRNTISIVFGTMFALAMLAGLGWFGYLLYTQSQSPPSPSVANSNIESGNGSTPSNASVSSDRAARRARAAEKVPLVDLSGLIPRQAAQKNGGPSPAEVGAQHRGNSNLPNIVVLDGGESPKSKPAPIATIDIGQGTASGKLAGKNKQELSPVSLGADAGGSSPKIATIDLGDLTGEAKGRSMAKGPTPVSISESPAKSPANLTIVQPVKITGAEGNSVAAAQAAMGKGLDRQMAELAKDPDLMDAGEKARRFATCICRDLQGRIWIGCEPHTEDAKDGGAWCFDPSQPKDKQWKQYTAADGLGDNYVYAIACDKKGRIWTGHLNHGLSVYNGEKWQCYEVVGGLSRPDTLSGPLGERIFHITIDPSGNVWSCTNAGLCEYIDASGTWRYITRSDGLPCDNCMSLAFDKAGNLYAATDCQGVAIAQASDNYSKWRVVSARMEEPATASGSGIPSNLCNDILVARDGTVWLATDAGLAWRKDGGFTWNYLRGKDWAEKVRGRLNGPPPGWSEAASAGSVTPLAEDYCTCLAEDAAGRILVGHRIGCEAVRAIDPGALRTASSSEKAFASAILPVEGGEWVAAYGSGFVAEGKPALVQPLVDSAPVALPAGCPPPTAAELNSIAATFTKSAPTSQPSGDGAPSPTLPFGMFEGEDWRTGGDWVGRMGRQYGVLFAADWPQDEWPTHGEIFYKIQSCIGPNHLGKRDLLRRWMQDRDTKERSALYDCWVGHRVEAYADDHGETYPSSLDGPDIHIYVTLPSGLHRVSLYFNNGLRDFVIEMRSLPDKAPGPVHGKIVPDSVPHPLLAIARANQMSGGVFKNFLASGPGRYDFIVRRNHSHNTNCNAVMIDRLTGADTYVDAWGLPDLGGHSYQAPQIPPPSSDSSDPELRDAARQAWDRESRREAMMKVGGPALQILAYRSATSAGDETDLLRNWRWHMRFWTNADREDFAATMSAAFKDFHRGLH